MLSHKCDSDIGLWLSIFLFTCRYQSWTAGTSSEGSRCNSRAPGKCQMGFGWNTMLILFETLLPMSRSSQLWQSKHICCVYMTLFNCPNWQPLSLFIGSLHWLSSWRWWPSMWGGKIVSATLEARNGRFDPFFLQISQITYLQMENFVFAILYLVYFALKYMYFEDLSRISENGGYL